MMSADRTIYIMGSSRDVSVACVNNLLQSYDINTIILEYFLPEDIYGNYPSILNEKDFSSCVDLDIEILPSGDFNFYIDGRGLGNNFIFWDKVRLQNPGNPLGFKNKDGVGWYRTHELKGLYTLLRSVFHDKIYNPPNVTKNMIKPLQQKLASDVGFLVPHTHISTMKTHIQRFYDQHRLLVAKTLNDTDIVPEEQSESNYSILTTPFSKESLDNSDEYSFYLCPHYVQQYIDKLYELRIIYVDGTIFAFNIDSQKHDYTKHDWRNGIGLDIFSLISLDKKIEEKLHDFSKKIGLFSGSFDFIVDKNNDVWFLECNQNGTWGWLDEIVDGKISITFAQSLEKKLRK